MKAVLEFTLPEEKEEHYYAINGVQYMLVLHELSNHMRSIIKYGDNSYSEEYVKAVEEMRAFLFEEINDRNLEL